MPKPMNNNIIPPKDKGTATAKENEEPKLGLQPQAFREGDGGEESKRGATKTTIVDDNICKLI